MLDKHSVMESAASIQAWGRLFSLCPALLRVRQAGKPVPQD